MKEIVIRKEELFEEFLAIFALGLTSCLGKDIINPSRAEEWLFSPVIAYSENSLMRNKVGENLINALQQSSALGDCIGTDYYVKNVEEVCDKLLKIIKKSVEKNNSNEKKQSMFLDIGLGNI